MIHDAVGRLLAAEPRLVPGPTVKDLARLPRVVQATKTVDCTRHLADGLCLSTRSLPAWPISRITGGVPLRGTVGASGSKNAALPMMAAAILAEGPVRLEGVPQLSDVRTQASVLAHLGVETSWTPDGALCLQTVDPAPIRAGYDLVRRMRASFCVLGPLLARRGRAIVSLPGGCNIGARPVDLHLRGLEALGATLRVKRGYVVARCRRLVGASIHLAGPQGPTVTGTANVLCAAVRAKGTTILTGAAVEPEIVDLGNFLGRLGTRIEGLGTPTLRIEGVEHLGAATYRIIPDRIEAATLLLAAVITRGSATVTGVVPGHLTAVLEALSRSARRSRWATTGSRYRPTDRPSRSTSWPGPIRAFPPTCRPSSPRWRRLAPGLSRSATRCLPIVSGTLPS